MNFMDKTKQTKIDNLLKEREKVKNSLKNIKKIFEEEKDNEESWPGHASSRYQTAEIDKEVFLDHLRSIEKELKELGFKERPSG